jgi:transcriptional regulator with XRE-family HTH domain
MSAFIKNLGRRVQELREEQKLTRAEVAEFVELTPHQVGNIERAVSNTTTETLVRLARIFRLDVSDLCVFPWTKHPRHRARELIRLTSNQDIDALVEVMERFLVEAEERDRGAESPIRKLLMMK